MNIALLGFGNVGKAFYSLACNRTDMAVTKVLSRHPRPELTCEITADFAQIENDSSIDTVIEVLGGLNPSHDYVCRALRAGKNVVTANKHLMVVCYDELVSLAHKNDVKLRCTAAAAGGIPWLSSISRGARMDNIVEIAGILNGTTNYILNEMTNHGSDYMTALKGAQDIGFAEKDPTDDVEALDPRRKLVLSANLAFGVSLREDDIPCFGISTISAEDITFFREHGWICKLFTRAKKVSSGVSAFVIPTLFGITAPEIYSNVAFYGERIGKFGFSGAGTSAGVYPTGSSVLADCLDIQAGCDPFYHVIAPHPCLIDNSNEMKRFYFRTQGKQFITEPICVGEAFDQIRQIQKAEPRAFMACLNE